MILRDLELSTAEWPVSAHSKGFSEMGAEEAGGARVYPCSTIHEIKIKSRGKIERVMASRLCKKASGAISPFLASSARNQSEDGELLSASPGAKIGRANWAPNPLSIGRAYQHRAIVMALGPAMCLVWGSSRLGCRRILWRPGS
jgi:hypothetical protein